MLLLKATLLIGGAVLLASIGIIGSAAFQEYSQTKVDSFEVQDTSGIKEKQRQLEDAIEEFRDEIDVLEARQRSLCDFVSIKNIFITG